MNIRFIRDRIQINEISTRAKLPADVWKAVAQAEAGDRQLAAVLVADGNCDLWVMSPAKYHMLMDRIQDLENELYDLKEGAASWA